MFLHILLFAIFFCPCCSNGAEQTSGLRFTYHHALVDKKNREFKHLKPNPQRYEPAPKPLRISIPPAMGIRQLCCNTFVVGLDHYSWEEPIARISGPAVKPCLFVCWRWCCVGTVFRRTTRYQSSEHKVSTLLRLLPS